MRTNWKAIVCTITALVAVNCGASREIQKEDKPLDPFITIEDGPSGMTSFDKGDQQTFDARGPSQVVLKAELEKLQSPTSYKLRLTWTFQGKKPSHWYISGEVEAIAPEGYPDPDQIEYQTFQADGEVVYVTRPLQPGRMYWYEINAIVKEPALDASVRLKTITVNLRDAR